MANIVKTVVMLQAITAINSPTMDKIACKKEKGQSNSLSEIKNTKLEKKSY